MRFKEIQISVPYGYWMCVSLHSGTAHPQAHLGKSVVLKFFAACWACTLLMAKKVKCTVWITMWLIVLISQYNWPMCFQFFIKILVKKETLIVWVCCLVFITYYIFNLLNWDELRLRTSCACFDLSFYLSHGNTEKVSILIGERLWCFLPMRFRNLSK